MAADPAWSPVVARLSCLRGISTLTGFALAVEIGDWHRFTGNTIGGYLGLSPCSPAGRLPRRRLAPAVTPATGAYTTLANLPGPAKNTVVANVAVARELAGWCWSLATMPD